MVKAHIRYFEEVIDGHASLPQLNPQTETGVDSLGVLGPSSPTICGFYTHWLQ